MSVKERYSVILMRFVIFWNGDFLERNERNDGIYNDVVYDRMRKGYRLEQSYKMKLTNPEILAICRQV